MKARLDPAVFAGILLVVAAAAAVLWANVGGGYDRVWSASAAGDVSWRFLINDGLMALFFLVVGLEIKRELSKGGALSEPGALGLPLACAIGGMVVPVAVFFAVVGGDPANRGWALPMATDIAFALAAIAVLGKRLPPAVRALLLTVAVIDDLGAVLVIAFFFSDGVTPLPLLLAVAGGALAWAGRSMGRYSLVGYIGGFVAMWAGLLSAGIHPTLAGVALGLMVPAGGPTSPAVRAEHALAPFIAFGVMPLFAFANAGVVIDTAGLTASSSLLVGGVALGLLVGKPVGVAAGAAVALRAGWGRMPRGLTWGGVVLVGLACSIGFTMSLFIAELAFAGNALLAASKLAIVGAGVVAIVATLGLGAYLVRKPRSASSRARVSPPSRSPRPLGA